MLHLAFLVFHQSVQMHQQLAAALKAEHLLCQKAVVRQRIFQMMPFTIQRPMLNLIARHFAIQSILHQSIQRMVAAASQHQLSNHHAMLSILFLQG